MRTRVKICGITRVEDALAAARWGVDSIGLVFYPPSARFLSLEMAKEIAMSVPPFVTITALFLDAEASWVNQVLEIVPIDLLQFHGKEIAADCRAYGRPYIKAIGMRDTLGLDSLVDEFPDAAGFLVDSHGVGEAGGTGEAFDWNRVRDEERFPLILAGGIGPENVALAIETARPWGVDLSSGVEISPGIKSAEKIELLMREVKRVDCR